MEAKAYYWKQKDTDTGVPSTAKPAMRSPRLGSQWEYSSAPAALVIEKMSAQECYSRIRHHEIASSELVAALGSSEVVQEVVEAKLFRIADP